MSLYLKTVSKAISFLQNKQVTQKEERQEVNALQMYTALNTLTDTKPLGKYCRFNFHHWQ